MKAALAAALFAVTLTAGPAVAQENDGAYVGVWDCGVGIFVFTWETYNPGDSLMPIKDVTIENGNYILSFADGYQIGLSSVTDTTMQWLSMESGDMFDCKRLYY